MARNRHQYAAQQDASAINKAGAAYERKVADLRRTVRIGNDWLAQPDLAEPYRSNWAAEVVKASAKLQAMGEEVTA